MVDPTRDHNHSQLAQEMHSGIVPRNQSTASVSKTSSMPHAFIGVFGGGENREGTIHTSTSIFDETNIDDESTI